jgi:transcriptional regulator with XRE-family HTH domain
MYLPIYLECSSMSVEDFAKEIGVSRSTIAHYLNGTRTPNLEIGRKIEKKTKGKVTIDELLEYAKKKRVQNDGSTANSTSLDI